MDDSKSQPIIRNSVDKLTNALINLVDTPATWFRETIVAPNRPTYYYYHRKFRRVPTIDECYTDDRLCLFEANQQYKRDRMVESDILLILRQRREDCLLYENPDFYKCQKYIDAYEANLHNYFIKYGEMHVCSDVRDAYMKQKHRMIWERRHPDAKLTEFIPPTPKELY
jgi:NADH dehydrogenase (ubiquinone) 1 beta subcomplex subunit 10